MGTGRSPADYLDEARCPTTSAARLDELAVAEWEFVRAAVAAHPNVSAGTLARLSPAGVRAADDEIALAIARRPDAEPDALRRLADRFLRTAAVGGRPGAFDLGLALLANPSTPADAVSALTDPERTTRHFRERAASLVRNPAALERLRSDVSERVRHRAQRGAT